MKLASIFRLFLIVILGFGTGTIVQALEAQAAGEGKVFPDEGRIELQKEKNYPQRKMYPVVNKEKDKEDTQQDD